MILDTQSPSKLVIRKMQTIGSKIRELRKQQNITQEKMGSDLNIDRSIISRWESEKMEPTIEQLKMLSNYFKIPISLFFDEALINKKRKTNIDKLLQKMEKLF